MEPEDQELADESKAAWDAGDYAVASDKLHELRGRHGEDGVKFQQSHDGTIVYTP